MGSIPYLSTYCQTCVGSYSYIPSCQAPKSTTSRGPEWVVLIRSGKPQGTFDQGFGSLPWVDERGGRGIQVVKSGLPTLNHKVEK
jgi:hypothetical protein